MQIQKFTLISFLIGMTTLFDGEAKGEMLELRDKLDSNDSNDRKVAAKRVVQLMRAGNDMSRLFASMLRCVKTEDMELKRLVYIYIVAYSTIEQEQSIMAVAALIQDAEHYNPLIRALAIRTMSRIHGEGVAENMIPSVKKALRDADPYVRKTAALAVAKLYVQIPEEIDNADVYKILEELLFDDNPLVISNAASAIVEINSSRDVPIIKLNQNNIQGIVNAISASTEWCQISLLEALTKYQPVNVEDAATLIDRLTPLLKSANPAVVIGVFRALIVFMDYDDRDPQYLIAKIAPPFVALVGSSDPEIQFVVLRTLSLFVMKYPIAMSNYINIFYVKYNDPPYIKTEKVDIIVSICKIETVRTVLDELAEYCNEVDVHFVQKSVRAIGQIANKFEAATRRCVDILVGLVKSKAEYAVEESILVLSNLLRKYPRTFDGVVSDICGATDLVKTTDAKAALVWVIGEYASIIDSYDCVIDTFLDSFVDEQPPVQNALITALVKMYVLNPELVKDQLQFVLTEASKETANPDVRNRAVIYWRLLSSTSQNVNEIIAVDKTGVETGERKFNPDVVDALLRDVGEVSGVLHILGADFVGRRKNEPVFVDCACESSVVAIAVALTNERIIVRVSNLIEDDLSVLDIAMNANAAGIKIKRKPTLPITLALGGQEDLEVEIDLDGPQGPLRELQLALHTSGGDVVASRPIELADVFGTVNVSKLEYLDRWASATATQSVSIELKDAAELPKQVSVVAVRQGEVCMAIGVLGNIVLLDFVSCVVTIKGDFGPVRACAAFASEFLGK